MTNRKRQLTKESSAKNRPERAGASPAPPDPSYRPLVDGWTGDDWFHHGAFRQIMLPFVQFMSGTPQIDPAADDYASALADSPSVMALPVNVPAQ